MKPTREILAAGALVLAVLSRCPRAVAQTNEARAAFQAGVQAYAGQHYAEALESFRTAYRIRPHPSVLVNLANCYVALNRPQDAISTFERFLNDPTVTPSQQQRTEIATALAEARRHLATINVLVFPPGAEVYLDGDLAGTSPLRRPLQTGPGPHVIEARQAGGGTIQHQARVEGGGTVTLTLDIARNRSYVGSVAPESQPPVPLATPVVPTPPVVAVVPVAVVTPATNVNVNPPVVRVEPARPVRPTAPASPPVARQAVTPLVSAPSVAVRPPSNAGRSTVRGIGPAFWSGVGITVAAAATSIAFVVYSNSLEDDYYRIVSMFQAETDASRRNYYQALGLSYADAFDQNRMIAYITGGIAGAAAAFSIGAAIYGVTGHSTPRSASLQVFPSLRGNGLTLGGTF